jgi:hypothetical protein
MLQIESDWIAYGLIVIPIASVHLWLPAFANRFAHREDAWIGFTGGIALGYVMLYMLPKISVMTMTAVSENPDAHHFIHIRAYLVLLAGVISFIAMDRLSQSRSLRKNRTARATEYSAHGIYNFLAGYVAVELPASSILAHLLVSAILAMHVMGMSNLLIHKHGDRYTRVRWILLFLVLSGGAVALITELPKPFVNISTALIGGIILLNVVSEELPTGNKHRFGWFLLGVGVLLAAMLIIVSKLEGSSPMMRGLTL